MRAAQGQVGDLVHSRRIELSEFPLLSPNHYKPPEPTIWQPSHTKSSRSTTRKRAVGSSYMVRLERWTEKEREGGRKGEHREIELTFLGRFLPAVGMIQTKSTT